MYLVILHHYIRVALRWMLSLPRTCALVQHNQSPSTKPAVFPAASPTRVCVQVSIIYKCLFCPSSAECWAFVFPSLSEMCLQSHSAQAVLCVPPLARLQMNYICPKVKEDTVAFASVLVRWVILPKQKGAAPPSRCHRLRDIMFCMKHENPLYHSRICKQISFLEKSACEVICFSPPWLL